MITQHTGRRTTDNRYVRIADDAWWDTTGVDIVPAATVDAHMRANPLVGEMVYRYSGAPSTAAGRWKAIR